MTSEAVQDEAIILRVRSWQTADKYAIAFTKNHGKVRFIAYGARYTKNVAGRLLQPFACLNIDITTGQKIDRLKSCELVNLPLNFDFKQMAYAAVMAELTAALTEDREPAEDIYAILAASLQVLKERNPRIITLTFALKLLVLTGFAPQMESCVACGRSLSADEDAWFSPLQGGVLCSDCHAAQAGSGDEPCGSGTRVLMQQLAVLDLTNPQHFTVRGENLMELEKLLYKFILFQTDKPLNSLNFLGQMGL